MIGEELAHAEHPNHGPRFWRLVIQHVPDYEAMNEWLTARALLSLMGTKAGYSVLLTAKATKPDA